VAQVQLFEGLELREHVFRQDLQAVVTQVQQRQVREDLP
jgi:hypothetical protein